MWKYKCIVCCVFTIYFLACGKASNSSNEAPATPMPVVETEAPSLDEVPGAPEQVAEEVDRTSEVPLTPAKEHVEVSSTPANEQVEESSGVEVPQLLFTENEAIFAANREFALKVVWLSGPMVGYDNAVELIFATADLTRPLEVKLNLFKPWMKIHGHGGGENKMVVEKDLINPYIYHARGFFPIMAGPWELLIRATIDGTEDSVEVPFKV